MYIFIFIFPVCTTNKIIISVNNIVLLKNDKKFPEFKIKWMCFQSQSTKTVQQFGLKNLFEELKELT